MMDAIWMNVGYLDEGSCNISLDEKTNVDVVRLFILLKYFDELLWDECITYNRLSTIAWVFTIKSYNGLSEAGYVSIIEWAKRMLPIRNKMKMNFYTIKSMIKPLDLRY